MSKFKWFNYGIGAVAIALELTTPWHWQVMAVHLGVCVGLVVGFWCGLEEK